MGVQSDQAGLLHVEGFLTMTTSNLETIHPPPNSVLTVLGNLVQGHMGLASWLRGLR